MDATEELKISVFNAVSRIDKNQWNKVGGKKNIYLTLGYLDAIEKSLAHEIKFRYLLFSNEQDTPVAIAVVLILPFMDKGRDEQEHLCHLRNKIKNSFLASSGILIMICGSPFACGENGFHFTNDISEKEAYKNLLRGLITLQKEEKLNLNAPVLLLKEFWPESNALEKVMKPSGFKDFMIDVNMVMKIHDQWMSLEDYLSSLVTKFRTKAKSAFKKSAGLQVIDFQVDDIIKNKNLIELLYQAVQEKSSFKFGVLNGETFIHLKRNLKDQFIFRGYFLKNELVGFSSAFIFDNITDANYVGVNYSFNQEHAIYQRMLYDFVELAILNKCKEVRFGRTAEEIKSTLGATPVNMKLYIRHQSKIKNSLLKPVFGSIAPSPFEQRNPFKAIYQNS